MIDWWAGSVVCLFGFLVVWMFDCFFVWLFGYLSIYLLMLICFCLFNSVKKWLKIKKIDEFFKKMEKNEGKAEREAYKRA